MIVHLGPEVADLRTESGRRLYAMRILPCLRVRYYGHLFAGERAIDPFQQAEHFRRAKQLSAKAAALMRWI